MEEQKKQAAEPVAWPDWLKIEDDTLLIHGIRYSQELFQHFGGALPLGEPFMIDGREKDGALTVLRLDRTIWPVAAAEPAIQQPQDERAAFEAWAELSAYRKKGTKHDLVGWYYFDDETEGKWQAWQARAALAKKGGA